MSFCFVRRRAVDGGTVASPPTRARTAGVLIIGLLAARMAVAQTPSTVPRASEPAVTQLGPLSSEDFQGADLTSASIGGGNLTDATLGLNWYLTPYMRITTNYVHAFLDPANAARSGADVFGMRMQYEF